MNSKSNMTVDKAIDLFFATEEVIEDPSPESMVGHPPTLDAPTEIPSKKRRLCGRKSSENDPDYLPSHLSESSSTDNESVLDETIESESERSNVVTPETEKTQAIGNNPAESTESQNDDQGGDMDEQENCTANGTRWTAAQPEKHKRKIIKKQRNSGLSYVNHLGKSYPKRSVRPIENHQHPEKSSYCCSDFTDKDRQDIFDSYWNYGENEIGKKEFLLRYTERETAKRCRTGNPESSRKKHSLNYYLAKDGQKLKRTKDVIRQSRFMPSVNKGAMSHITN
uniref:Uncharacterized protein n=1 Tax=Romanomermis culicivorax TaxID=13658 RepID=A0A915J4D8_ROMCU